MQPLDLVPGFNYFWRARAADPTTAGPYSAPQGFIITDTTPVVTPPPPSGGGGSGQGFPAGAVVWDNPPDLASWAQTATITSIQFTSDAFLVDFDKRTGPGRWPDVPFG